MIRVLVVALQFAGIRTGRHAKARMNPVTSLTLAAVSAVVLSGLIAFAVFHLAAFHGVTR